MLDSNFWLDVFPALDNVTRFNILIYLNNEGSQSFSIIQKNFHLSPGNAKHHLDKLMEARLIGNSYRTPRIGERDYSYYQITPDGKRVLDTLLK